MNELWHLTEAQCEELRVLQTVTPFVSADLLVKDFALSKVRRVLPTFYLRMV